jgi:hypothetical protein
MFASDRALINSDWGNTVVVNYLDSNTGRSGGVVQSVTAVRGGITASDSLEIAGVREELSVTFTFSAAQLTGTLEDGVTIEVNGRTFRVGNVQTSTSGASVVAVCEEVLS